MPPDLRVALGPVALRHPVICGAGEHVADLAGLRAAIDAGAAAVVAKSANESDAARRQWDARAGTLVDARRCEHPVGPGAPRDASLLNRSGLVPAPWEEWLQTLAAADAHARDQGSWVIASLIPADEERLPGLARDVEAAGVRWLELNLSAPHSGEAAQPGTIERVSGPERARALTERVRAATTLPLTVKLAAESHDVVAMAAAARAAGADHVAMIGRHMAFLPDLATRRAVLGSFGAIGGAWALPLALRWVAKTRLALGPGLPLIGTNGARDGGDVARFLLAGACAVQVATSVVVEGFGAVERIRSELEAYLSAQDADAAALVGEAADAVLTYEEAAMRSRA